MFLPEPLSHADIERHRRLAIEAAGVATRRARVRMNAAMALASTLAGHAILTASGGIQDLSLLQVLELMAAALLAWVAFRSSLDAGPPEHHAAVRLVEQGLVPLEGEEIADLIRISRHAPALHAELEQRIAAGHPVCLRDRRAALDHLGRLGLPAPAEDELLRLPELVRRLAA